VTDAALFGKSLLLGLAVAAPLGPIGALCISRTLDRGFGAGVAGGLGTALADALYAALAAAGFATFASVLDSVALPLRLAGGAFMLWLGLRTLAPGSPAPSARAARRDLAGTTAATFALTMANPMTILSFAALFAGLGLASSAGPAAATLTVAGVFAGSMLWWVALSGGVALARHRLPPALAVWVSRASGGILIAFGLWALASGVRLL
jgi:putative LysE/RhtB family amino acid efflux pump